MPLKSAKNRSYGRFGIESRPPFAESNRPAERGRGEDRVDQQRRRI